ncbi:MAG: alpha-ketoglutarate-dependent dioxygenase AlkB [Pricia sp.]
MTKIPNLFSEPDDHHLGLPDSDIRYFPDFLDIQKADIYFEQLRNEVPWQQDDIKVFGKVYPQPRLTALYSNNGKPYSYSNITMQPHEFSDTLLEIKNKIETKTDVVFTTCLLNLYRHGKDSNGWHADNEKELGKNPVIASVTLGQERYFHLKHRDDKSLKHKILLQHGSLLLMEGATQHHWLHQIAKTARTIGERINLTFRVIV